MDLKNRIIFILFIAIILEIFIFNFRYFESLGYKEIILENPSHSEGLTKYNDEKYYAVENRDKYIQFDNINCEINNIYIEAKRQNYNRITDKQKLSITIRATDEANENFYDLPERYVIADVERSHYIKMNLLGKTEKLQIVFNNLKNEELYIERISINKNVPFKFNILRFCIIFSIMVICYILRPKSSVYNIEFNVKSVNQIMGTIILAAVNIIIIFTFVFSNPYFLKTRSSAHLQYYKLTESLLEGHFYLNDEVSDELKDMENPYDTNKRKELKVSYKWDQAYFNGKYYVYFGIVPVLLFYLPIYLITGNYIWNEYVIMIIAFIYLASSFLFIREIIRRWFKHTSYAIYLLLSELMFLSTGAVFPIKRPDFYFIPVFLAMALGVMGLYLWISSIDEKNGKFIKWRLFFGSVCMALIAGTRPQILMASFLAIPLFWKKVFKERIIFSRKSIKETLLFIIPYVVTAAFIMYYNYSRFGSVYDFGANYNLTTNDMTKRGFVWGRIPEGIFMYLFEPAVFTAEFPFIKSMDFYTNYMGMTIHELMFGGAFASHLILTAGFLMFRLKKYLKRKNLFYFSLFSFLFAFVIVIADTQMAGLLQRYTVDFVWFLFVPAIICILMILEKFRHFEYYGDLCSIAALLCGLSFLYDLSAFFFIGDYSTSDKNPEFFYNVMYSVQFWL